MMAPARPASTICLLREGDAGTEVLMVQRAESARFMAGVWVFPGGVLDEEDNGERVRSLVSATDPDEIPWVAACLRELVEEVGLWITTEGVRTTAPTDDVFGRAAADGIVFDGGALACFARWITPAPLPMRFDTKFYVALVEGGNDPGYDPRELSEVRWVTPSRALQLHDRGDWVIAFPTRTTLSVLESTTPRDLLALGRGAAVEAVQPRIVIDGAEVRILVPGDEGFEAARDEELDPDDLQRLMAAELDRSKAPGQRS
jgi:8-oxo-dGTP pyrophosphatase MutT (NUDIX family)